MRKRKERSPEEEERRAKIRELLELSGVSSMEDIQSLFKCQRRCDFVVCRRTGTVEKGRIRVCAKRKALPSLSKA